MPTSLGVYVGNRADELPPFERYIGKPVDAVLAFTGEQGDWGDCDPSWQLTQQWLGGTGRPIRWSIPMVPNKYGVDGVRAGANGNHNSRWTGWAHRCLAHRSGDAGLIYVRTAWELGGEWFGWTKTAQADPESFKKCFANFSRCFKSVSSRFRIVWDTVPDRGPQEGLYPGDDVVDVIGQDVYWHPEYDSSDPVAAFNRKLNGLPRGLAWIADFARQHGKRMAIPEYGVPGGTGWQGGEKHIALMRQFCTNNPVDFMDYWGGTSAYDGLLQDGTPAAAAAELRKWYVEGNSVPNVPVPPTDPNVPNEPVAINIGNGEDELVLEISQDYYRGDAQYTVKVDDVQVGDVLTAKARRGYGTDMVTVHGDWGAGSHKVTVTFLNDAGGVPGSDRNLYLEAVFYNDMELPQSTGSMLWSSAQMTVPFEVQSTEPDLPDGPAEDDVAFGTKEQRSAYLRHLAALTEADALDFG